MSVIGLDLGTSGVRAVAFAAEGDVRGASSAALTLLRDGTGRVELEAGEIITAAEDVVRRAAQQAAEAGDPVQAIGFSVLGEAVVPIDEVGAPVARMAVSMDTRGTAAAAAIGEILGEGRFTAITGQPLHGMFSLFKIMAGDAAWAGGDGYRCVGDLLAERWSGVAAIDLGQAARTGILDVDSGEWSTEILRAAAVSAPWVRAESLPVPVTSGSVIGPVNESAAAALGIATGTPLVAGTHDQAAAFLGAGGEPGVRSVIALGSSDCLTVGSRGRPQGLGATGFASYRVDDELWVTLAGTAAGGWALEWLAGLLKREVADVFGALADAPPALLVLPYLAGSGTLDNDPSARGTIHGLTLDTTVPELARAVVEAAGFEFHKIIAALRAHGVEVSDLHVTGAGAENADALAARAAAAGASLTPVGRDASARGAAMLAVRGIGGDPAPLLLEPGHATPPGSDDADADWYADQRAAYVALYEATRSLAPHLTTRPQPHQKENMT
ncbi:L-fuculokinase [Microbacterium sp. AK031]|uniref:FGGY-family carbohydrate kinase n=1 Tax=Microbacterium sp. AK031 TaxID=2723076 RepID=UPI002167FDD4|nr:FGGY family carbohydrate kinase [Microbacterium sp. AK031]MCS3843300.1 xylulokinase [Microbacterium sp. AK031]